jgi:hypothetical protein
MVHVHMLSLIISTLAALVVGASGGVYGAMQMWGYLVTSPKHSRTIISRLHARAHAEAMSCPCCDAMQVEREAERRERMRSGIETRTFLARMRTRKRAA